MRGRAFTTPSSESASVSWERMDGRAFQRSRPIAAIRAAYSERWLRALLGHSDRAQRDSALLRCSSVPGPLRFLDRVAYRGAIAPKPTVRVLRTETCVIQGLANSDTTSGGHQFQ